MVCSNQTLDLEQIYNNYILFNSFDDQKTVTHVPLLESIAEWMDLTYGFQ